MDRKTIYLLRHGETELNRLNYFQGGGVDPSLNERGRAQAKAFFEMYKNLPLDIIYTSTLRRSIESVESFIRSGIPHGAVESLNEISWGYKDGTLCTAADAAEYADLQQRWQHGELDTKFPGGESPMEVLERLKGITEEIILCPEQNILICTHGRVLRIWLAAYISGDLREMHRYNHHNTGLYTLRFIDKQIHVQTWNSIEHLKNLSTSSS